ncbi:uncharacterized protein LOC111358592 [Spodoptera litura]|uniref:Uncharacterized protein LOC111358592 n=1 Tax=Spodoptera litura TaxID=69820 RepID=A0A9J7EKT2_SPOLT|nr:uncharacterized protein LOC111358592 [Spodoptera litura]
MNHKQRRKIKSPPYRKRRQMPTLDTLMPTESVLANLQPVKEETKADLVADSPECESNDAFKSEVERFIEISKYFSSPLRKTASYICENRLVSYPSLFRLEFKRGVINTEHIKFCNITLEPVYIKLFKVIPDLEQIRFTNLSLSRCKRIPPGLSFNLTFLYDDVNEKPACNAKMIFVASRKTSTPCYQVCEIELDISAQKTRLLTL